MHTPRLQFSSCARFWPLAIRRLQVPFLFTGMQLQPESPPRRHPVIPIRDATSSRHSLSPLPVPPTPHTLKATRLPFGGAQLCATAGMRTRPAGFYSTQNHLIIRRHRVHTHAQETNTPAPAVRVTGLLPLVWRKPATRSPRLPFGTSKSCSSTFAPRSTSICTASSEADEAAS